MMEVEDSSEKLATHLSPQELNEIQEVLATVLESVHFRNSLQCRNLLQYVIDHTLAGEDQLLRERVIGAEVFGRKADYEPGEDPVVRVRASEVRKRLAQFYQSAEPEAAVVIQIPSGSYRAVFSWRSSPDKILRHSDPSHDHAASSPTLEGTTHVGEAWPKHWRLLVVIGVGLILISGVGLLMRFGLNHGRQFQNVQGAQKEQTRISNAFGTSGAMMASSSTPIRILAGYTGKPLLDRAGNLWQADSWFQGGGVRSTPDGLIARTCDPQLFNTWRSGDFNYDIPLAPGDYELHLYFLSTTSVSDSIVSFGVTVNGSAILNGFDITTDAMGENIADERVFRDISPAEDGHLHLAFSHASGKASINAIEILPGTPHTQLPIRLITQPTSYIDHDGQLWHPDNYYMGGRQEPKRLRVEGSTDPEMYAFERVGHFSYAIPVDTRGRYTLVLHFAELYIGANSDSHGETVGGRVFKVICNGSTLLDDFDIYKDAGALRAVTKTFHHLKPTAQGKLNLTFEPVANLATVSAIEVLEE